jgi:hypothetical protein
MEYYWKYRNTLGKLELAAQPAAAADLAKAQRENAGMQL